jgi:hypothetical protein
MLIILAILIRLIGRMKHSEDADTRFEILGLSTETPPAHKLFQMSSNKK